MESQDQNKNEPSKTAGAPTKYSQEVADSICESIATTSDGLRKICKEHKLHYSTVKRWLQSNEQFCAQYARAKEEQAEHLIDEMLEIADDSSKDTITIKGRDGSPIEVEDKEWTSRSKLRVDTRKWIASKLKPKKYGEKVDLTTGGAPINMDKLSTEELKYLLDLQSKVQDHGPKG